MVCSCLYFVSPLGSVFRLAWRKEDPSAKFWLPLDGSDPIPVAELRVGPNWTLKARTERRLTFTPRNVG